MELNKLKQLVITMEECGELIQACSKLLRRNELYGNSAEVNNLKSEIGDVMCMIMLMAEWDVISHTEMEDLIDAKRKKLSKWSQLVNPEE